MLANSDRVRPCNARFCRSSLGRSTTMLPSSWRTVISPGSSRWSEPCGPLTATTRPLTCTSTPDGTVIGDRPILLISSPHVTEDLAAHAATVRLAVGHEPVAGGKDRDAEA